MSWGGKLPEVYKADGLGDVLAKGYGDFSFSNFETESGKTVYFRATIELRPDIMRYGWERSSDGVTFTKVRDWIMKRDSGASAP